MPRPPTLQQIADRAGVSKNTVSGALRNLPGYARTTCEQVQKLALEMGYRSNPLVSALMRSMRQPQRAASRGNLAYLHTSGNEWKLSKAFSQQLFEGARERGSLLGFHLDPVWLTEPGMTGSQLSKVLRARGVEGLIISPLAQSRGRLHLDWNSFACVSLGFSLWRPVLHRVATYQYHVVSCVFRNLRRLGYERIGVLLSRGMDTRLDFAWEAGLAAVVGIHGSMRVPPLSTDRLDVAQLKKWLGRHEPDVIVDGGLGLDRHLAKLGIETPRDIGYVSLLTDGSPDGAATIRPDWKTLGATALDVVAEQLIHNERGIPAKPRRPVAR